MVHCFGEHLWVPLGRLCVFRLAGWALRQKQRPASCYSKVTNVSSGCDPIKGRDLLGIYGGGSQPGQRAGAPWPEVFEDLLLPVNSSLGGTVWRTRLQDSPLSWEGLPCTATSGQQERNLWHGLLLRQHCGLGSYFCPAQPPIPQLL